MSGPGPNRRLPEQISGEVELEDQLAPYFVSGLHP